MRTLVSQLELSLDDSRLYCLSLFTALTVPDIAGALDAQDGRANPNRYKSWYETWVRPVFATRIREWRLAKGFAADSDVENPLSGDACYRFRCSLLHQGTTQQVQSSRPRIIFVAPGATTNVIHYAMFKDALCIDLPSFCREMIDGTNAWLASVEGTGLFQTNYDRFARLHEGGLPPYISGVPVVG